VVNHLIPAVGFALAAATSLLILVTVVRHWRPDYSPYVAGVFAGWLCLLAAAGALSLWGAAR
jgi:hypothetical protein